MSIRDFMSTHFRHFNAAATLDAAKGYEEFLGSGGRMLVTLAGAMSTAELGRSLAEMIRRDMVHGISCTGANLEEDVFRLVAMNHYERVANYRDLTPADELALLARGLNRVTDTCIPEEEAFRKVERKVLKLWQEAECSGQRRFPHEYLAELLLSGALESEYEADPNDSWLLAAAQKSLPIFVPGWEDSTLGNVFAARVHQGDLKSGACMKTGIDAMRALIDWYRATTKDGPLGFFQIGGGIAGDFPICVVPLIRQDLHEETPLWGYFCQISDATTSYGGYSGAVPNEKITWEKLGPDTPKFMIESDATIVAPLIFGYLLDW